MRKILLDTSVLIDFLRRTDKENSLLYKFSGEDLYISLITHTELYAGKSVWEKEETRLGLEKLLSGITVIPMSVSVSMLTGRLKSENQKLSLIDCVIAATALKNGLELATLNRKDFVPVKGLKILAETADVDEAYFKTLRG